jgi:hypothetical protein
MLEEKKYNQIIKVNSYIDAFKVSELLGQKGVKHLVSKNRIICLGRLGVFKLKNGIVVEGSIFSERPPKENLMFMANVVKQIPEFIDRAVDISRAIDDDYHNNIIDTVKRIIKYANLLETSFKELIEQLSFNKG